MISYSEKIINGMIIGWELNRYQLLYGNKYVDEFLNGKTVSKIAKDILDTIKKLLNKDKLKIVDLIGEESKILTENIINFYKRNDPVKLDAILLGMVASLTSGYLAIKNQDDKKNKEEVLALILNRLQLMGDGLLSKEDQADLFIKIQNNELNVESVEMFYIQISQFMK